MAELNQTGIQSEIEGVAAQAAQSIEKTTGKKLPDFIKKKPFIISVILVLILLITLVVISNRKVGPTTPSGDILLVTVGDLKIYKSTVQLAAQQQYDSQAINNDVLKIFLNNLIEQDILELEAAKANIKVEATESAQRARSYLGNNAKVPVNLEIKARYDLLKEKLMSHFVSTRTAHRVAYWTPGPDYPQEELTQQDIEDARIRSTQGKQALAEVNFLMRRGIDPLDATRQVISKNTYADFAKIVTVNGYLVNQNTSDGILRTPKVFTTVDRSFLGDTFYNALFAMKTGEVKLVFGPEGAAGSVFKVLEAKDGQYKTYEEWLSAKKEELVIVNNSL